MATVESMLCSNRLDRKVSSYTGLTRLQTQHLLYGAFY